MDWMDVEELAATVCGLGEDYDSYGVEIALARKFEVSFEQFQQIVESLAPYTVSAVSPLTGNAYRGFASNGAFIYKIPA